MYDWLSGLISLVWGFMPYYTAFSIVVFSVGLISLSIRWFSRSPRELGVKEVGGLTKLPFGTRIKVVFKTIFGFWAVNIQVFRRSWVRWVMHISIFLGAVGEIIFHGVVQVVIRPLSGLTEGDIWFPGTPLWIRIFFHNLFFLLLIFGASIALARRIFLSKMREVRNVYNLAPLLLIFLIGSAGLFAGEFSPIPVSVELQSFFLLLHSILVYTTIAYLPYGKFVHFIATPAIILKRAIDDRMREEWYRKFGGGE
nr:hypothetical protein [Candidatus Njordarchaeota archaeon]